MRSGSLVSRCTRLIGLPCLTLALVAGCVGVQRLEKPPWVDGASERFPSSRYLVGLGQDVSQPAATEKAYAAVARIFKAEIRAQARDWESYMLLEGRGKATHQRRLTIDHVTQVSTDKVLENVRILDRWVDTKAGIHYALAGMNRTQAEAAMLERIRELDRKVQTEVRASRTTQDPLAKIRNLRRAANHLVMREAYNADLRVIRQSGQGNPPRHRVAELTAELEEFIATKLTIRVDVTGEQAEPIRRSLMEGLVREGLPVINREHEVSTPDESAERSQLLELLVTGTARLWKVDVPDPTFSYVRWCSDFVILDVGSGRVVGAVSKRGREGHLTDQEARNRAARVMQQELTTDLARSLAGYVYGETDEAVDTSAPSACPRDEEDAHGASLM